jgi:hypothetical protein
MHILPATASVLPALRSSEVDLPKSVPNYAVDLGRVQTRKPHPLKRLASSAKVFPVINFAISINVSIAGVGVPVAKPSSLIGIKPVGTSSVTYLWLSVLTALFAT